MEENRLRRDGEKGVCGARPQRMRDFDRMTKLEGCIGVGEGGDELEEGQMVAALCRGVLTRLRLSWGPLQRLWGV
jgi:hypothetical protein